MSHLKFEMMTMYPLPLYLGLDDEIAVANDFAVHIPLATRQKVWEFWDSNSEESTLTTLLAKLCVADMPKCLLDYLNC